MLQNEFKPYRRHHRELERLICRAFSEERFASELLRAPARALAESAHRHNLSAMEQALVTSITASDIHDFAAQLHMKLQQLEDRIAPPVLARQALPAWD